MDSVLILKCNFKEKRCDGYPRCLVKINILRLNFFLKIQMNKVTLHKCSQSFLSFAKQLISMIIYIYINEN